MSQSLEFDPSRRSAEDHLEAAKNRLLNAQAELEQAREEEKPEAQIATLEHTVKQYQGDVDGLQKDIEEKTMGMAA
jgi:hypothetical protein